MVNFNAEATPEAHQHEHKRNAAGFERCQKKQNRERGHVFGATGPEACVCLLHF